MFALQEPSDIFGTLQIYFQWARHLETNSVFARYGRNFRSYHLERVYFVLYHIATFKLIL